MGQSQSRTASKAQPASRDSVIMGKRVTAPSSTADTMPPSATNTPPTLTFASVRSQLKHLTSSFTPAAVDAVKRGDESAVAQFAALHSQLAALYNNTQLPDEYEVRVHELWSRAETLRTAMNVASGLKERGTVAVSEMEGEDERDRRRQQARRRVGEVAEADRQQRRQAVELQKMAARRDAQQTKARSKKASKQSRRKKRKAELESESEDEMEEEDESEGEETDEEKKRESETVRTAQLMAATRTVDRAKDGEWEDEEEEKEAPQPAAKRLKSATSSARVTRTSGKKSSEFDTPKAKQSPLPTPPPAPTPTKPTSTTATPKTYTRSPVSVAAKDVEPAAVNTAQPTRRSPRKAPQLSAGSVDKATRQRPATPSIAAAATPSAQRKSSVTHAAAEHSDERALKPQRAERTRPAAAASKLNLTRLTAKMTPERQKAAQRREQAVAKEAPGPGVGRSGKRRRSAVTVRGEERDIYDVFDA